MPNYPNSTLASMKNQLGRSTGEFRGVSLFTGIAGMDLGMELASDRRLTFDSWVENNEDCQETLLKNIPKIRKNRDLLFGDINNVTPEIIMSKAGIDPGELFVLTGGPPCQAFSTAGLRKSLNDDRGSVVYSYFQMVKKLKPRFFVFENVRGLLSAAIKHRPLEDRTDPKEIPEDENEKLGSVFNKIILPSFKRLGYEMTWDLINSADYGTAQERHRVIIMGSRDREFGCGVFRKKTSHEMDVIDILPPTHHRFAPYHPIKPWRTLRDAIGHLDPNAGEENTYSYSDERKSIFNNIPMGENWKYVRDNPDLFPRGYLKKIMGGGLESGGGKTGFWRRLHWDRPTPTLTCQPQQLATSLCHPELNRPLSIPEYSAIQDFPHGFDTCGSKSSQYEQIGNAVPLKLSGAIGSLFQSIADIK
jgi:DNA (cytosine-5)-methyltransferase 1